MKIYDYAGKKNISGERIREARTKLHLTQTNLAVQLKLAGVDVERDSISRIEIGTRFVTDYEICELSKILKVTPASYHHSTGHIHGQSFQSWHRYFFL